MLVGRRFSKKVLLRLGIVVTGVMLAVVGAVTYYGQNVGNFVISVDEDTYQKAISISEDEAFTIPKVRLVCDPLEEARDVTYNWIQPGIKMAENHNGQYFDPIYTYIAYTFYVKNVGLDTVDLTMFFTCYDVSNNLDKSMRVLIISTYDDGERSEKMYMAPDEVPTEYDGFPPTIEFVSNEIIMDDKIVGFAPNKNIKFTIVIWLEGEDPDCTESIMGGRIKFRLRFVAVGTEEGK